MSFSVSLRRAARYGGQEALAAVALAEAAASLRLCVKMDRGNAQPDVINAWGDSIRLILMFDDVRRCSMKFDAFFEKKIFSGTESIGRGEGKLQIPRSKVQGSRSDLGAFLPRTLSGSRLLPMADLGLRLAASLTSFSLFPPHVTHVTDLTHVTFPS